MLVSSAVGDLLCSLCAQHMPHDRLQLHVAAGGSFKLLPGALCHTMVVH
jgi:hypothetical protein